MKRSAVALSSLLPAVILGVCGSALGSGVTGGNLVIYRVGDGASGLVNTGAIVFIDEYTTSGSLVQSIQMPSTGTNRLIASGTATAEGYITASPNGSFLSLTGYNAPLGTTGLTTTSGTTVNRAIGVVTTLTGNTAFTNLTDFAGGGTPRSAVTTNGTDLWMDASNNGARYTTAGSTTSTQLATAPTNLRQINIFGGQLYTSASTTTFHLATIGTGTPTSSGQTITNLPGFPATGSQYGFVFFDLDAGIAGLDTVYVCDDSSGAGVGGILKYSLVSGSWVSNGVVGVPADAYRGLTGYFLNGEVTLFATRKGGSGAAGGGELVKTSDNTGYNGAFVGTPTLLATAGANTAFRGVAWVVPTPAGAMLLGMGGLLAARRRRN